MELPALNACLNGASFLCLLAGFGFIRRKKVSAHRAAMGAALFFSALFLGVYVYHAWHNAPKSFEGAGLAQGVYFLILITHTFGAMALVPLVFFTLRRALQQNISAHRRLARVTFPLWVYVSFTGVLVYFFLYHFA